MTKGPSKLEPGEAEAALAELVEVLESDDYQTPSGAKAVQTAPFFMAKALVALMGALERRPWWRRP
jgi:hypothetical protein